MRLFNTATLLFFLQLDAARGFGEQKDPQKHGRELQFSKLAGYQPLSDVTAISKIDLDMAQILTAVGVGNYPEAEKAYNNGTNVPGMTLAKMSTTAEATMVNCGARCPYSTFKKYLDYYGVADYGHRITQSAFDLSATQGLLRFNTNFTGITNIGRAELVKKGAVNFNSFAYVIREMEVAITSCKAGSRAISSWDSAFAVYAGSLEGADGSGPGNMLYDLADKRCINFKACGPNANEINGTAYTNLRIVDLFSEGQMELSEGACAAAEAAKVEIEKIMLIPFIHGLLRYSWILKYEKPGGDKIASEGLNFATVMLPLIHTCNASDAEILSENMKFKGTVSFVTVKALLEKNYECLGVKCDQIGGLFDTATNSYSTDAAPCKGSSSQIPTISPVLVPTKAPEPVAPVRVDDDPVPAPFLAPVPVFDPVEVPSKAPEPVAPVRVDDDPVPAPFLAPVPVAVTPVLVISTKPPVSSPTMVPVKKPTMGPVKKPSMVPVKKQTMAPSKKPTKERKPTSVPLRKPTKKPTKIPVKPSKTPTKG